MSDSTQSMLHGESSLYMSKLVELKNGVYLNIYNGKRHRVARGLQRWVCGKDDVE